MFPKNRNSDQFGGIFVYVFIGVILFALLAFTFSRSQQGVSSSVLTSGQAKILAANIISYSNTVERAVQKLISKGCSETQISFRRDGIAGYNNTGSPPDETCHVFEGAGGKVTPKKFDLPGFSTPQNADFMMHDVIGIGTTGRKDLTMKIRFLGSPELCREINNIVAADLSNSPLAQGWWKHSEFTGDVSDSAGAELLLLASDNEYLGRTALCYQYTTPTTPTTYFFYRVLNAR